MKPSIPATIKAVVAGIALMGIIAGAVLFSGCATPATGPLSNQPTALDQKLFTITTNVVDVTNIVTQTNTVVVASTNAAGSTVFVTNTIQVPVPVVIPVTNFIYAPSPATQSTIAVAGTVASATGTPWAGLIGAALSGIVGLLAVWKTNAAKNTATAIAGNTAQVLQVARNVIANLPNGAALTIQLNAYMMAHQQDANLANEVAGLVDTWVDPNDNALSGVASQLIAAATTPPATGAAAPKVP